MQATQPAVPQVQVLLLVVIFAVQIVLLLVLYNVPRIATSLNWGYLVPCLVSSVALAVAIRR